MRVEIISIGDELLIGQVVNSNAAWMGRELTQQGFNITAVTSVGDQGDDIIRAIDHAFGRADIILLTGGVGPTTDDITKHTLCRYFHTALEFNDDVLQQIESLFLKRNIQLNQLTRKQAYVPVGATVIQNKVGTAPILWFRKEEKVLISMPGVPFEMRTTMLDDIIPRLQAEFQADRYLQRTYLVSGITESALATRLAGFETLLPAGFTLAYLPSFGFVRLRLSVWVKRVNGNETTGTQAEATPGKEFVARSEKGLKHSGEKLRKQQLTVSTAKAVPVATLHI